MVSDMTIAVDTQFTFWMQTHRQTFARLPPTLRSSQPTWAVTVSSPVDCYRSHLQSSSFMDTLARKLTFILRPTEVGRLRWP